MIPIRLAPEPPAFDADVRQPGQSAIAELLGQGPSVSRPGPRRAPVAARVEDLSPKLLPDYWTRATPSLLQAYGRQCAYVCLYIEHVTGSATVDHWAPKSRSPRLAYEWSNYRLACSLVNARKHTFEDLIDPFDVVDGMFALEFGPRIRVVPGPTAGGRIAEIERTIAQLGLDGEDYSNALADYEDAYTAREITFVRLMRRAPFLGRELERQGRRHPEDVASEAGASISSTNTTASSSDIAPMPSLSEPPSNSE